RGFEYEQIRRSDSFIPYYQQDAPKNIFSGIGGYAGVIKLGEKLVPVIDVFVFDKTLKNKLVVTDIKKLGRWVQYSPITRPEDEPFKDDFLSLRIADLNAEDELRSQ